MSLKTGIENIKSFLVDMPSSPGVYRMIDEVGGVLYVGKAKNLQKRVTNYTHPERLEYRIQNMIAKTVKMEIITTKTEAEALLLEANLIKKFEPKYNILLRDDKSYPYILIEEDHDFPRISKHRGARKIKGSYYGPFASAGSVNKAIADLQKAFLVRPCNNSFFSNRKTPCMEYQIKRCSAPCVNKISKKEYAVLIDQVKSFLSGKSRAVQEEVLSMMGEASSKMDYEKAAIYRDRIKALNHIQAKQNISSRSVGDADVIGMHMDKGECCIQIFFFRGGQNYGNNYYFPKHTEDASEATILQSFLSQFYGDNNFPPDEIILSHEIEEKDLLEEVLSGIAARKIKIIIPKLGDKKELIKDALRNAENKLAERLLKKIKQQDILEEVAKLFEMKNTPKRIEIYDNSHISGKYEVGAMVVAGVDGFNKKAYRRYNMKDLGLTAGDDYAMMREMLTRRLKRLKQDAPDKMEGVWPDIMLIDGGRGHLTIVSEVMKNLDVADKITYVCISKGPDRNAGREQFHMEGKKSFTLPHNSPVMHYLQVLRDEAHSFAIGSHRNKRSKSIRKSVLDEIEGIGKYRKKLLINHFGSVDDIKGASLSDIKKVKGISGDLAQKIFDFFNG